MSRIQAILLDRGSWTLEAAIEQVRSMGYKPMKVDVTARFYRFRIESPRHFGRMRYKKVNSGMSLILGWT